MTVTVFKSKPYVSQGMAATITMITLSVGLTTAAVAEVAVGPVAEDRFAAIYLGTGHQSDESSTANKDTPFSVGLMAQAPNSKMIFGFDIAGEGTMLDSTYYQDENPSLATSFNLLLGSNVQKSERFRTDVALLAGIRESVVDCPDSYLGYQCYADSAPTVEYVANFGAVVTVTVDKTLFGVRVTGESAQVIVGYRF